MVAWWSRTLAVWRWLLSDFLLKHAMPAISLASYLAYRIVRPFDIVRALKFLLAAHRYYPSLRITRNVTYELPRILQHIRALLGFQEGDIPDATAVELVARRTIVLKWPRRAEGQIERGVILITFTTSFPYYYLRLNLELLQKWFTVVLEPSWAGYCLPEILMWAQSDQPVIVQATERTDFEFLAELGTNLVPVDFGASDWVDHRLFAPRSDIEKEFDVVYVGNYRPIKRHHVLFKAVKQINDASLRVALACTPWGGGTAKQVVHDLMKRYDVEQSIVVYEGLKAPELNALLNRSKVCVLLSLKEGSNRSIFEGFFANVPGIVLSRNVGVNKSYINERTGHLVDERDLANSLRYFRDHWREFSPRRWALENISPEMTTRKLESRLRELARSREEPWTTSIRVKVNRPEVEYFDAGADQFPLTARQILSLFDRANPAAEGALESVLLANDRSSIDASS